MVLALTVAALTQPEASSHTEHSALRLKSTGADPWVTQDEGRLYYTQTTGEDVRLWSAESINELAASSPITVWRPGKADGGWGKNVWAPELHGIDGRWYIYFAADDGKNENHRMYVLASEGDALGPYELKGRIAVPGDDRWAIDGTQFEYGGKRYFIWSGWPGETDGKQNLYIARMKNPWTLEGPRVLISSPEHPWESWINEGPEILKRGDRVFLAYSANRSWTDDYKLGMLELTGKDALVPSSWKKFNEPIFDGVRNGAHPVYGPGHCSFLELSGSSWLFYHVARHKGAGWNREVRVQQFYWSKEGEPEFRRPLPIADARLAESVSF